MVINSEILPATQKVLLIDVGGTNIRTCSAFVGSYELLNPHKENTSCLDSFDTLIQSFLDEDPLINHIVFSVAGPKINNAISMTNRDFKLDANDILLKFDISSCHILNDWESIGYSLSLFDKDDMSILVNGDAFNATSLIIGPGTGLGAALVINDMVLPTEIGNSTFSINSLMLNSTLKGSKDFNIIEDLISGRGLSNIYRHFSGMEKSPEEIVGTYHEDNFAKKSIDQFLICLSQVLSELALAYIPGNGIYLAGGFMRSLLEFVDKKEFIDNFLVNRKPMHVDVLKKISISLIQKEMTCLHGNLNYFNKLSKTTID
jgi:glucokinase